MTAAVIIAAVLFCAAAVYVYLTAGRFKRPAAPYFYGALFAHRGLHSNGIPENSLPAFEAAVNGDYGIELDVHLTADGELVVHHDDGIKRLTGEDGKISEMMAAELTSKKLCGTEYSIPLFSDVLSLVGGRVPLVVELKRQPTADPAPLCERVFAALDAYKAETGGEYCVESFNPYVVKWCRLNRSDAFRGQLTEAFYSRGKKTKIMYMMENLLINILGRPDFTAYNVKDRANFSLRVWGKLYSAPIAFWTVRSQEELDSAVREYGDKVAIIFEGFIPDEGVCRRRAK